MNYFAKLIEPNVFEDIREIIPSIGNGRKIKKSHFSVGLLDWILRDTKFDLMDPHSVNGEYRYYTLRDFTYNGEKYFIQYYMLKSELDLIDLDKNRKFYIFPAKIHRKLGFPLF